VLFNDYKDQDHQVELHQTTRIHNLLPQSPDNDLRQLAHYHTDHQQNFQVLHYSHSGQDKECSFQEWGCLRNECSIAGHQQEVQCPCASSETGTVSSLTPQSQHKPQDYHSQSESSPEHCKDC
jgi:hypothetical protein